MAGVSHNRSLHKQERDAREEIVLGHALRAPVLQTGEYWSHALGRYQPYAVFVPADTAGAPRGTQGFPLLVMLHGRTGNYLDWPTFTRIARYIAAYSLVVAF